MSVLSSFTARQFATTSARPVSSSPHIASKEACFTSTSHPVRFSISSHISASIPVHLPSSEIRLYGSPVPDVTTVTFFPESFLSSLLDSELAFLSESSDLALLPHPATVPTVIIVTNKAANTRFFIILNLLFFHINDNASILMVVPFKILS